MLNNISEDLKKIFLAGVGAVAITAEKSKDVIEELVKKGELTVEDGKVLNEELKHTMKEKFCDGIQEIEKVSENLSKYTKDELEILKKKIEELQKDEENGEEKPTE